MPVHSPFYRELNFRRIKALSKKYSDRTIAGIVSDELGERISVADLRGYLRLSEASSVRVLVSMKTLRQLKLGEEGDTARFDG